MANSKEQEKTIRQLQRDCVEYLSEISKRDHTISILSTRIDELNLQLQKNESAGSAARKIYNEIDDRIMLYLNTKGARAEKRRKSHPHIEVQQGVDLKTLLMVVEEYDVKEFFRYHKKIPKANLKLPYRVAAKTYRTLRDGSLYAGKRTYRLVKKES